jgi:hypothetical protein
VLVRIFVVRLAPLCGGHDVTMPLVATASAASNQRTTLPANSDESGAGPASATLASTLPASLAASEVSTDPSVEASPAAENVSLPQAISATHTIALRTASSMNQFPVSGQLGYSPPASKSTHTAVPRVTSHCHAPLTHEHA